MPSPASGARRGASTRPAALVGVSERGRDQWVWARVAFALAVLAFALGRAIREYASTIPLGGDPWMTGDWLINYAGGFVRRGLFGELFLAVAPAGEPGLWGLFAFQLGCYGVVLAYCVHALILARFSWSAIALLCGPVGLAFVGWDTQGGFRKEILVFALLALLAWSRRGDNRTRILLLVSGTLPLWALSVFSWESTAQLLPAVVYLLWTGAHRPLVVFRRSMAALYAVVAGVGAVLSALAHGEPGTPGQICAAVRAHGFLGPDLCGSVSAGGGGIDAIGWTSARAILDVAASWPLYVGFLPLIGLALLPVVASRWFTANWGWFLVITVAVLPMYFVVTDYGRWTHVLVMALAFCVTAADPLEAHASVWNPLVAVLYVTLWGMPHHLAPDASWYGLGLVNTLLTDIIQLVGGLLGFPTDEGLARAAGARP